MRLEAVAGQETLIGLGIAGYAMLMIAMPIDLPASQAQSDDAETGETK